MRRLLLASLGCVLLVTGLASPSGAATSSTVTVRGTNGSNPQMSAAFQCSTAPAASSLSTATSGTITRYSPWQDSRVPSTPVPGLAPMAGSRYLSYSGAAGYGHGPVAALGANRPPTSVSAYVAAPSGSQSAVGFVVAWGAAAGNTVVEYVGFTSALTHPGVGWSKVAFNTSSPASSSWSWYALAPNSSGTNAWSGPLHYTLAQVESGRAAWTWKAGVLVGCGDAAAGLIDDLAVTSSAGTTTYDFEGAASSVSASVSSQAITYGQSVNIAARSSLSSVPLRVVRCQGVTCQYVGSAETSSPAGPIGFQVFPDPGWTYGVRFDGDATFNPSQVNLPAINVRPYLTAALSQHRIHVGQRVNVGGIVGPCTGAARHLVIQRKVGHKWRKVGRAIAPVCSVNGVNQYAKFHGSVRARGTGRWKLRILVPPVHSYATATSHVLRLRVTRAPVKHVTTVHYAPPPSAPAPSGGGSTSPAPPPPPQV